MVKLMKSALKHSPQSKMAPPARPVRTTFSPSYDNHALELLHKPRYMSNLVANLI